MIGLFAALIVPAGYAEAPVYSRVSDGIMARSGTFLYKPSQDGYRILYCVSDGSVKLQCVVSTPNEMLVVIQAEASERSL
jgi:hypothetical protein